MMAIMLPSKPKEFHPYSLENKMFEALEKLSDDHYVFHSFSIVTNSEGVLHESETDFVIFHPQKGIISLEAKAGRIYYQNGIWYYANGYEIKKGGPYRQASLNKWKLEEYFKSKGMKEILSRCKTLHAVWFPSIDNNNLYEITLPSEADNTITMTKEALDDPCRYIDKIFEIQAEDHVETNLSRDEIKRIIENILCPSFELVPSLSADLEIKKDAFNRMLKEQSNLLNYLEEQPYAIINGAAGTGKTMIAVEKARRHAEDGEQVLFLCYNKMLNEYLKINHSHKNIQYYTIDKLACALCNTTKPQYDLLETKLLDQYYTGKFPYKHIIIDEGQDFGIEGIEESNIISTLEAIVLDKENHKGTFYLFYDKNQLVQGAQVPNYILDSDCKLTLYKNCRNTENIAVSSMRPLRLQPKLFDAAIKGDTPEVYITDEPNKQIYYLENAIKKFKDQKIKDIVILTCSTESKSFVSSYVKEGYYNNLLFTTCRKFKGLEADAVILIDINRAIFEAPNNLLFYVGASRAKIGLKSICKLSNEDCTNILKSFGKEPNEKRLKKDVATILNGLFNA